MTGGKEFWVVVFPTEALGSGLRGGRMVEGPPHNVKHCEKVITPFLLAHCTSKGLGLEKGSELSDKNGDIWGLWVMRL